VTKLGIRANRRQFLLLLLINGFVGAMVGMERSVLPLLAQGEFALRSRTLLLSFILTFGLVKAVTNLVAGGAADALGRRNTLLAGWLVGLPVPFLLMFAPAWGWIVAANVLLGVQQGLCWSATVMMKVDLAGPRERGMAVGLNEAAGYLAVSLVGFGTAWLAARYGLRPWPFTIGIVAALGGMIASWFVADTRRHVDLESRALTTYEVPVAEAFEGRSCSARGMLPSPVLCQAGLVSNLNDAVSWGLLPIQFAALGLSLPGIGLLVGCYPAVWALGQLLTGTLSDRVGRKPLIVAGMLLQGGALLAIAVARGAGSIAWSMAGLGAGTALAYPTLIAAVSDEAPPARRASVVGRYRFWRDLGYAVGALVAGLAADRLGIGPAIVVAAAVTLLSGGWVLAGYRGNASRTAPAIATLSRARPSAASRSASAAHRAQPRRLGHAGVVERSRLRR
jgi:MFS family permease